MFEKRLAMSLIDQTYDNKPLCNIHYRMPGVFSFAPLYCGNLAWMKIVNRFGVFYICKECSKILADSIQETLLKDSAIVGHVHSDQKSLEEN